MGFRLTSFAFVFVLIITGALSSYAQESDAGTDAYNAGDYATAERIWRGQAAEGNAAAKYNMGILYENGFGVTKNMTEAKSWYTDAANQDNEMAVKALADIYYAEQNYTEALTWYGKAAEKGDASAQVQIGNMYLEGQGVTADEMQAVAWIERAAGNAHLNAQHWLGDWYWDHQDNKSALKWYDKAASGGIAEAEPKRNEIYETLFAPALNGENLSELTVEKKAIELGLFNMMGQQYEIKLGRKYSDAASGSALRAVVSINDFQGTVLIDYMYSDPSTIEDAEEKAAIEAVQASDEVQTFEFGGYKGIAQYKDGALLAAVLKLDDNLLFEYDVEGTIVPASGIEAYLPKTDFARIIETLDGHGFEESFLASERGQQMFNDFSEDIARELEEQESSQQ